MNREQLNHKASKLSHPSDNDDDEEARSSDDDDAGSQSDDDDDDVSESDEDEVDYKQGGYHRVSVGGLLFHSSLFLTSLLIFHF